MDNNDVVVADGRISGRHGRFVRRGEGYAYEDVGSRNGSLLERGALRTPLRAHEPVAVIAGDRLLLGDLAAPVVVSVERAPFGPDDAAAGATVVAAHAMVGPGATDALDATTQTWQRILAARLEALLAARTLLAEQRQFDVGLRTSVEVLDASARLADAQSREVLALAAYQNALVDIAFATGTSLGSARIRWEPFGFDELPELERLPDAKEPATRSGFTVEQPAASMAPAAAPQPTGAEGAAPAEAPAPASTPGGG
jgi:pSer/pThr/pTyr-binding forkhead associated (FHA) protein